MTPAADVRCRSGRHRSGVRGRTPEPGYRAGSWGARDWTAAPQWPSSGRETEGVGDSNLATTPSCLRALAHAIALLTSTSRRGWCAAAPCAIRWTPAAVGRPNRQFKTWGTPTPSLQAKRRHPGRTHDSARGFDRGAAIVRAVEAPCSSVTMALWQGLMAQVRHLVTLVVGNAWGIGAVPTRRERLEQLLSG